MRFFNARLHDEFLENAKHVKSAFIMEAPMMCMGKVDLSDRDYDDLEDGSAIDEDIYNGTYITPHGGSARVAYHLPTNTLCLFASKTPVNLRGQREGSGYISANEDGLRKSYIIAAYRLNKDGSNLDRVRLRLREALQSYDMELGKRAKKHFGQFAASFKVQAPTRVDADNVGYAEVFTNGYAAYVLKRQSGDGSDPKQDDCSAEFHASARRSEGRFEPIDFGNSFWNSRITRISKNLSKGESYSSVRQTIDAHWGRVSSKLWDQESLYSDEGIPFTVRRIRANVVNYINDTKKHLIPTTAVVGAVLAKDPALGVKAAVTLTVGHAVMHKIADGGLHGFMSTYHKVREARKRGKIEDYGLDEDVSDYFKIHNKNNLSPEKIAPKMCMKRFDAADFCFLEAEQSGLMHNHQQVVDGMRPEDVRSLLLFAHQRGFTSTVGFLDKSTRFDAFQNGIMRVMHKQPDGNVVVHAQYQPELCTNEVLRLPEVYVDQFKGGILRFEYDPKAERFSDGVSQEECVPHAQAIHEISHTQLFRGQPYSDDDVKERSFEVVRELFEPVQQGDMFEDRYLDDRPESYRGGKPFPLPDADAISPQDNLD